MTPDHRTLALVTTTINVPRCLEAYLDDAERHGHADRLIVLVVGDRRSPPETGPFLAALSRRTPARVEWLDPDAQQRLLRPHPALAGLLRWDSIQRRNLGYLVAVERGADVIISVDDDNFVVADDFFGAHGVVGRPTEVPVVSHPSGWWNVCERLGGPAARPFHPRGFPKSQLRWTPGGTAIEPREVVPVVNAGLWLGTPDVDATTHLEGPIVVERMAPLAGHARCALAPGTWCPFSTQNTAFDVEALPAMYLVQMGDELRQRPVGRADDIWMSFFLRAIADQLGRAVTYGPPLVRQDRNAHDFLGDLAEELGAYVITEILARHLRRFHTTARDWLGAYIELAAHLREAVEVDESVEAPEREYVRVMTQGMTIWAEVVGEVSGAPG